MRKIFTLSILLFSFGNVLSQVVAGEPDDLIQCDVNNPGDETEIFDLTTNEAQIINGQSNVVVTYHLTSGGALSGINALPNPENYQNIANPEPIWARLQSTAGQGWSVTSFQIFVPKIPVIATPPDNVFIDEGDGDSMATFDLTVNESQMLGGVDPFDFQFSYFTSESNAMNNVNPIADPEAYTNVTNPQVIYGRYEYFITGCDVVLFDFEIQTDGALGIGEETLANISIAPNPVSNNLSISLPLAISEITIEVFNMQGSLVANSSNNVTNGNVDLDVHSLSKGTYFVRLTTDSQTEVKTFIKR